MLCLCGFELYSRWVPLTVAKKTIRIPDLRQPRYYNLQKELRLSLLAKRMLIETEVYIYQYTLGLNFHN